MRIERISDNQVKIMLNRFDLDERNIKLSELAYGSEKTQELFKDLMEMAQMECGFEASDMPLMIEAIPFSSDNITIIVTKVNSAQTDNEKSGQIPKIGNSQASSAFESGGKDVDREIMDDEHFFVFSFDNIDEASNACAKLLRFGEKRTKLTTMLFKNDGRFLLYCEGGYKKENRSKEDDLAELGLILTEFGAKHTANSHSKYYLIEHAEIIIKEEAIQVLADLATW